MLDDVIVADFLPFDALVNFYPVENVSIAKSKIKAPEFLLNALFCVIVCVCVCSPVYAI